VLEGAGCSGRGTTRPIYDGVFRIPHVARIQHNPATHADLARPAKGLAQRFRRQKAHGQPRAAGSAFASTTEVIVCMHGNGFWLA